MALKPSSSTIQGDALDANDSRWHVTWPRRGVKCCYLIITISVAHAALLDFSRPWRLIRDIQYLYSGEIYTAFFLLTHHDAAQSQYAESKPMFA